MASVLHQKINGHAAAAEISFYAQELYILPRSFKFGIQGCIRVRPQDVWFCGLRILPKDQEQSSKCQIWGISLITSEIIYLPLSNLVCGYIWISFSVPILCGLGFPREDHWRPSKGQISEISLIT